MAKNNIDITIIDAIRSIVSNTENEVTYEVTPITETTGLFKNKKVTKITEIKIKIIQRI